MAAIAIERLGSETPRGLFPIGKEVISGIFDELEETGKGFAGLVRHEEEIMESENPEALNYLESLAATMEPTAKRRYRIGISLAYMLLEKRLNSGIVPTLSPEFVDAYELKRMDGLSEDMEDPKVIKKAEEGHIMKLNLFHFMERSIYNELEKQMFHGSNVSLFESPVYTGLVYAYFLFREGLSDPANLAPRLH